MNYFDCISLVWIPRVLLSVFIRGPSQGCKRAWIWRLWLTSI